MNEFSNGILELKLKGRLGNQLFIYFIGRIFAEKNKLNLITEIKSPNLEIEKNKNFGKLPNNLKKIIIKDDCIDKKDILFKGIGYYIFDGYFQNEDILYENRNLVLSWINYKLDKKDDLTIHIRLDDYFGIKRHLIINVDYYIDCIKKYGANYKNIYIICDKLTKNWEKQYINKLSNKIKDLDKNPIYITRTIKEDFEIIYNSSVIITSNSTFCFWPVFLSNADKIIAFPYLGFDVLANNTLKSWDNNPIIFKNKEKFFLNYEYNDNILNYFEKLY